MTHLVENQRRRVPLDSKDAIGSGHKAIKCPGMKGLNSDEMHELLESRLKLLMALMWNFECD